MFPTIAITPLIEALDLLNRHNVFQIGDTFWHQQNGTAMGAPPAPTYANISFATYEKVFLPKYRDYIIYYKRYIDDIFAIWKRHKDATINNNMWTSFIHDLNNWHGLKWDTPVPSQTVEFLDVVLTIENNKITSTLFEKKLNRHLYIPPRSAHPPGVLRGLISGHIYRAYSLCSNPDDAHHFV